MRDLSYGDFSFGEIVRALKVWWATLPKTRYIIGGIALVALGFLVRSINLTTLEKFCDRTIADLGLIQPFSLLGIYFHHMAACDHTMTVDGEFANCSPLRFLHPMRFIGSLIKTIVEVWGQSAGPGFILLPLALIGTYPIAASMIISLSKRMFGTSEFNIFHGVLAAPLTPFILSVIAFVFQMLGIALFFVFGKVIGLVILVGGSIEVIRSVWKAGKGAQKNAETLEAAEKIIRSKFTSDPVDHSKAK